MVYGRHLEGVDLVDVGCLEMMVHVVEEEGRHEDWRMVSLDGLVEVDGLVEDTD